MNIGQFRAEQKAAAFVVSGSVARPAVILSGPVNPTFFTARLIADSASEIS
jgi:hypothetical protein